MALLLGFIASMWSLNREITDGPQRYLKSLKVSYWVAQPGTDSLSNNSFVRPEVLEELRAGGYQADGMLVYFSKISGRDGIYQSYQPDAGVLDPLLVSGRQVASDHETVLDHVLASDLGVRVGSTVTMVGRRFTVVGLARESNSFDKQTAYINQAAMASIVGQPTFQVVAIRLRAGQAWPPPVSLAGYEVVTHQHFIATNQAYQVRSVTSFFQIIIGLSVLMLMVSLSLLVKLGIDAARPLLGLLRLVGCTRWSVVAIEALGAGAIIVPALAVGSLVSFGIIRLFNASAPGITASLAPSDLLLALVVAVVVSLVGMAWPIWRLMRLTPMEAIRSV